MTRSTPTEGPPGPRRARLGLALGLALAAAAPSAAAAEIRGEVLIEGGGRFGGAPDPASVVVSVAAFPLEGQTLPRVPARRLEAVIRHGRFRPLYQVLRPGDVLTVRNGDRVYHEIFSFSTVRPFRRRLSPRGGGTDRTRLRFEEPGTWHVFCRIHGTVYLRLDVVDTPHLAVLRGGGRFHLRGLAPGRWRLRVAAVGADDLFVETSAVTRPPPLRVVLRVRGAGGAGPAAADGAER